MRCLLEEKQQQKYRRQAFLIVSLDHEPHDLPHLLTTFGLAFCENKLDSIAQTDSFFWAVVRYENHFKQLFQTKYPHFRIEKLSRTNENLIYPVVFKCTKQ